MIFSIKGINNDYNEWSGGISLSSLLKTFAYKKRVSDFSSETLFLVRPAWAYSNGCKSLSRPDNGKATAKDKGVRGDAESEGSRRQTSALTDRNMI